MSPKPKETTKNRKYPEYNKLDIDSEVVPENYYDSSAVCKGCGTRWPNIGFFNKRSLCCYTEITISSIQPDFTWKDAVSKLNHIRFEVFYEKFNNGLNETEQLWLGTPLDVSDKDVRNIMKEVDTQIDNITKLNSRIADD